jgi:hypothetical protein
MDKGDIAIVTMTWARDAAEERLLRASLPHLAGLTLPTFVTDGGSGSRFTTFLRGFSHFTVLEAHEPGVWPQVRRSLQAANESAARFLLYTEPDKGAFFRGSLHTFISEAPASDDVGVVLASRSAASFSTFPEFQRYTEATINRCCAEVIGAHGDFTYGPFLLNRGLVPYLDSLGDDIGWGWRPYAFGMVHRLGYRVEHWVKDLPCPRGQRTDSKPERLHRMRQLSQSIQGLLLATTVATAHT